MKSAYFSGSALRALNRIGDILVPANGEFEAFSKVGGLEHIDKLVAFAPQDDIKDLNMVLTIMGFMPGSVLRWFVNKCTNAGEEEGSISVLYRQLNLALRGLIFSCYYAERPGSDFKGKDPVEVIGFELNRVVD